MFKASISRRHDNWKVWFARVAVLLLASTYFSVAQEQCVDCADYVAKTAAEKEAIIQQKILNSPYKHMPHIQDTCDVKYDWVNEVDFNSQFDRFSDERSPTNDRFFHLQGMTAPVEFVVPAGTPFTGIFAGASHGILRVSPLAPVLKLRFLTHHFSGTFLFSFALKLFRDGMHSANILTGDTLHGRRKFGDSRSFYDKPDFNIFSRPVDNMPGIGDLGPIFGEFESLSGVISTADAASYTEAGIEETTVVAPVVVHFVPNPTMVEKFGQVQQVDFRKWAADNDDIADGLVLYEAYSTINTATQEPSLCLDDQGAPVVDDRIATICPDQEVVLVGDLILKDRFRLSAWGDDRLFFQHTRACPKDQRICQSSVLGVEEPFPWFSQDTTQLCQSSDDKSGGLTGTLPTCPNSGTPLADYCYPGTERNVEKVQIKQCPMVNLITNEILGVSDAAGMDPSQCGFFLRVFLGLFGWTLSTISFVIRLFVWPHHHKE